MGFVIDNTDATKYKVELTKARLEAIGKKFGGDKVSLLEHIANELEYQDIYSVNSFYRPYKATVRKAISFINTDTEGEKIKDALYIFVDKVIALLDTLADGSFITKAKPYIGIKGTELTDDFKTLDEFIEPYTYKHTFITTENTLNTLKSLYEANPNMPREPLPKLGTTTTLERKGFIIKKGSEKTVAEFLLNRPYACTRDLFISDQEQRHNLTKALNKLAVDIKIATANELEKEENFLVSEYKGDKVVITATTLSLQGFIEAILSILKDRHDKRVANARTTNKPLPLRKDYGGDYMAKPPIDMTIADMENPNPEKAKTLNKVYRNSQALDNEGGLLATVSDPTLFDMLPAQYQEPTKIVSLINRANRRGMVALFRYMVNNPEPPAVLDTVELAKSYGAYDEQIKKQGRLPTPYLKEFITELTLIKGTETYYTYYDYELKKEMIGSVKFFDFDISTDGRTIKNLHYSQEYIDRLNDQKRVIMHLALPKSLDYLKTFDQDIAFKILQRFVGVRGEKQQKKRISKTVNGEGIKIEICDLYRGYINARTKQERARAKKRTIEALENIKNQGEIITDYKIVTEGRKTFADILPSDYIQSAYRDKTLDEALESQYKNEQKLRRADLRKLAELYRKDLRENKHSTDYLDALAEDLHFRDRGELGRYMIEPNKRKKVSPDEIDDDLYDEIKDLIDYFNN